MTLKYGLFITVLFLMSCHSEQDKETGRNPFVSADRDQEQSVMTKLFGTWGIYVTKTEWSSANCNACPTLTFDRGALLRKPSGDSEFYTCHSSGDTIFFRLHSYTGKAALSDTSLDRKYLMIFTETKDFTELELKNKEKNYSYILRK